MAESLQPISCSDCGAEYTVDFGDETPQEIVHCGVCGETLEISQAEHRFLSSWSDDDGELPEDFNDEYDDEFDDDED
jgi:hypothetical protein